MSDTRLAMREFRFLDEKRKLTTLSSSEEQRWRELKQALGAPEPTVPVRSQAPSRSGSPDPSSAYSAGGNAYPKPNAAVPPNYAPHTTPGYGQTPAEPSGYPPLGPAPHSENSTLPAAELLGLSEGSAPPQRTVADTRPTGTAKIEPSSAISGEAPADDVVELDPSEVTLLDAGVRPVPPGVPLPSFAAQAAAPQPPIAAETPEVGAMIDLSTAEAIDTGEFNLPETRAEQPAPGLAPPPAADLELPSQSPAPVFTQPPVALEEQQPVAGRGVVEGEHRVIIHTHEGQVKRGVIRDVDVWANAIALEHSGQSEEIPTERIKAIFFMKAPGGSEPAASGQKIRVTLADGRQVLGFSTDFQSEKPGFFLVPADVRTNTSRIYLFRSAVDVINPE